MADALVEKEVKVGSATTGKAQRMPLTAVRSRGVPPPLSAEELQRRQEEVPKRRRPARPPSRTRALAVLDEEAVPEVEETDCEEPSAE